LLRWSTGTSEEGKGNKKSCVNGEENLGCPSDGIGRKELGGCYPLGVNMNSNKCAIGFESALK